MSRHRRTPNGADAEALVTLAYRAVLRREPDVAGLARYVDALRNGHDLAWLIALLATSEEFQAQAAGPAQVPPFFSMYAALPMAVDLRCSPEQLQALWDHIGGVWSHLGETEPHWSVLTDDQFRAAALGQGEVESFYASGVHEVSRLNAWLRRAGLAPRADAVCAEYGCGVGRITPYLAQQYGRVTGFDVSVPHLRTARERFSSTGVGNVELVHVTGSASLHALQELDVFYSILSLQHSPPPIILDVLRHALAALRPGGYAFFQVPTYSADYSYSVQGQLEAPPSPGATPKMEMHFVPQHAVLDLAYREGLAVLEVQPDGSIGRYDKWISTTFLLMRPRAASDRSDQAALF